MMLGEAVFLSDAMSILRWQARLTHKAKLFVAEIMAMHDYHW